MDYYKMSIKNMLAELIKSLCNNSRIVDKKHSNFIKILLIPGTTEYTYYKGFDVKHEKCVLNKIVKENPKRYVTKTDKHELEDKLEKMLGSAVIELSANEKIKSSDAKRKALKIENCLLEKPGPIRFIFKLKNIKVKKAVFVDDQISIYNLELFKEKINVEYEDLKELFFEDDVILEVQVNERDNFYSYNMAKERAQKVVNLINFVDGVERGPYVELENINFKNTEKSICYLVKNEDVKGKEDYIWKLSDTLEAGLDGWNPPYYLTDRFDKWANLIPKILETTDYEKESDLEKNLVNSIDWLGRAAADTNPTNAFLETMIALESICETKQKSLESSLKKDIPFRGVKSNCPTTIKSQIESIVRYICNDDSVDLGDIYDLRSRIVHDGEKIKHEQHNDFVKLYKYAQKIVEELLFNEKYKGIHSTYDLWKMANQ